MKGEPEPGKTILVVENEALIALDESEMLEANGFRVIVAESGEEAVAAARANPSIDLVLMDVDLGGEMDGTDAARVILAERDIPVVFLSSHTEKELVEKTDAITSYGYVFKDSGDVVLLASIRMAFSLHDAHTKLKESEERYRTLVEQSPAAILIHQNGIVRYGNQAAAKLFGAESWEEFLGRNAIEAVHPEDRQKVVERVVCTMQTGEPAPLTLERFITSDGRVIHVQVAGARINWEGRAASQTIGIDVTEQILAQRELEAQSEKREAFFNSLPVIVWYIGRDGGILWGNEFAAGAVGLSIEECLNKTVFDLFPEEHAARFHADNMEVIGTGLPKLDIIEEYRGAGGEIRWAHTSKYPLWDKDDTIEGVMVLAIDITERVRAETGLRDSESRQRSFLNAASDMAFIKDENLRYLMVNQAYVEFLGRPEHEILGRADDELMASEAAAGCRHSDEMALREDRLVISNEVVDGRTYETRKFPVMLGGKRGVGGFARDITEARRDDDALRESELKYRRLFELESDAIFLIDNETGRLMEANEAASRLYGYSRGEFAFLHNYDLSAEPDQTRRAMQDELVVIPIRYHRKKNGEVFPVEITATYYEWKGRPVHIAAIRDIGLRLEAERMLRESEERYALIANNVADTITIMDLDLNVIYASPSIKRLRGFTVEEVMIQKIDRILTPESIEIAANVLREELERESDPAVDLGRTRSLELQEYHKNGSVIWIGNSLSFIRDENYRPYRILIVSRDITERKLAERALEEALAENRTLLYELRHRVKNSIAMIASMVGLEAGRASGRETREVLDDMRNRILSLSHMYDMIHAVNESNTIRLDAYIHRIVRSLSETLAYDRERISIGAECGQVTVDAQRAALFGLIVNELVTNSIKHAFPEGCSGTVRIELAGVDDAIRLTVSDNGAGLGESFEIGRSDGLGMKLVRLLARQMKADLTIDGVGGTRFSVFVAKA